MPDTATPHYCKDCKFCQLADKYPDVVNQLKFSLCTACPRNNGDELIDPAFQDYFYCSIARTEAKLCGRMATKFQQKDPAP